MKINKGTWPAFLAILSFAGLSVFGLPSSFNTPAGSLAPASASKKDTLKMLSAYRTWAKVNQQTIVLPSDIAPSV